jgi:hypothetical protein
MEGYLSKRMLKLFRTPLNLGLLVAAAVAGLVVSSRRAGDALITHVPILCEVLKGPPLSLRNEKCGEDTSEHESREDLHDVVEPWVRVVLGGATSAQRGDGTLGDDRTNLSSSS